MLLGFSLEDLFSRNSPATLIAVLTLAVLCDFVALGHLRAQEGIGPASKRKWLAVILLLPFVGAAIYSLSRHRV